MQDGVVTDVLLGQQEVGWVTTTVQEVLSLQPECVDFSLAFHSHSASLLQGEPSSLPEEEVGGWAHLNLASYSKQAQGMHNKC